MRWIFWMWTSCGLDQVDRQLLLTLIEKVHTAAPWVWIRWRRPSERTAGTMEDVYEPYLIQNGFLNRTPAGTGGHRAGFSPSWYRSSKIFFSKNVVISGNLFIIVGENQPKKGRKRAYVIQK